MIKKILVGAASCFLFTGVAVIPSTAIEQPAPTVANVANVFNVNAALEGLGIQPGNKQHPSRAAIRELQARYEMRITGQLNQQTEKHLRALEATTVLPSTCLMGERTLCVDMRNDTVKVVSPSGEVLQILHVRFGGPNYETRTGKFTVQRKGTRGHISTLYKVPMPYPVFFSGGQAVHFSYEFAENMNKDESHGCVGTRDLEAQEQLWSYMQIGDPVVVVKARQQG